jgi:hypothetical protein
MCLPFAAVIVVVVVVEETVVVVVETVVVVVVGAKASQWVRTVGPAVLYVAGGDSGV